MLALSTSLSAVTPSWFREWIKLFPLFNALIAFQNCFGLLGSSDRKKVCLAFRILTLTRFLNLRYSVKFLDHLARLYDALRLHIVRIRSLLSHGKFLPPGMVTFGIQSSIMSINWRCQLDNSHQCHRITVSSSQ